MMRIFYLLLTSFVILSCKEEMPSSKISGKLTDSYTKEPIANATISILEDGPSTTTDEDGLFSFNNSLTAGLEEVVVDNRPLAAI